MSDGNLHASDPWLNPKKYSHDQTQEDSTVSKLRIGDTVRWTSQAGGIVKEKAGKVIEIVPEGIEPASKLKDPGFPRNHESYVVLVGKKNYWPLVSKLQVDAVVPTKVPVRTNKRLTTCPTCHGSGMVMKYV